MIASLALLLCFQLAGEVIRLGLGLSVPGPVIGMLMLLVLLTIRRHPGPALTHTADGLLRHLSLLFVPAGTGVMLHLHRIGSEWLPISVALVVSTALGVIVAALVLRKMGGSAAEGSE